MPSKKITTAKLSSIEKAVPKKRKKLKPVTIAGIEFDALIEKQETLSATIPSYPIEKGFPVSDTIILDPITVNMTLYISDTPVTWLHRHGSSVIRSENMCRMIKELWEKKKLVKIVTSDAIYKDMGITSISIKKSYEIGYAREISIQASKVYTTKKKTAKIPSGILKSGETKAKAGSAKTSSTSNKSNASTDTTSSGTSGTKSSNSTNASSSSTKSTETKTSSSNTSGSKSSGSKSSVAYKAAKSLGLL